MKVTSLVVIAVALAMAVGGTAKAAMFITEWEYNGSEFVEFTNVGGPTVDMTGWSFDDNSRAPGSVNLSAFGNVAPNESVILSEVSAADFRTTWSLPLSVKVIGGNSNNLGRADEVNLYDAGNALVDRLTYDDQGIAGSIRTDVNSGNPKTLAALGANEVLQWQFSANADIYGSYSSVAPNPGHLGNPGKFTLVPEPAAVSLMLFGIAMTMTAGRRRVR
jgi:predicted extracellular nuclease